jgi:hypothetical protein
MMQAHAFKPSKYDLCSKSRRNDPRCDVCGNYQAAIEHTMTLAGMETTDQDREAARQAQQAQDLTAELRRPLRDISAKAGEMERRSPLFHGTGDNPTLF